MYIFRQSSKNLLRFSSKVDEKEILLRSSLIVKLRWQEVHHVVRGACYYVYLRFLWLTSKACTVSGVPWCVHPLTPCSMRSHGPYVYSIAAGLILVLKHGLIFVLVKNVMRAF